MKPPVELAIKVLDVYFGPLDPSGTNSLASIGYVGEISNGLQKGVCAQLPAASNNNVSALPMKNYAGLLELVHAYYGRWSAWILC